MVVTARLPGTPFTLDQETSEALSISWLTHNPPLTPPAKTLSKSVSERSNKAARVLPPALFGPTDCQLLLAVSPGARAVNSPALAFFRISLRLFWTAINFSEVGYPKRGFIVSSNTRSL